MSTLGDAVRVMLKRPFIIIFLGVVVLVCSILNYYNPIFTVLFGLSTIGGGNIFDSLLSLLQLIVNLITGPNVLWVILLVGAFIIVTSVLSGFLLSGYMNIISNALDGKPKFKGEFTFGVKKYFSRITAVSFRVWFFGVLFVIFMMIACVPAVVMTRVSTSSKPEFLPVAVFFDVITIAVLFFGLMFFRMYAFFWYPAALSFASKSFTYGKRIVDRFFWSIFGRFLAFDLVFVLYQVAYVYLTHSIKAAETESKRVLLVLLAINWLFKTVYFSAFITYIFSAFKTYLEGNEE